MSAASDPASAPVPSPVALAEATFTELLSNLRGPLYSVHCTIDGGSDPRHHGIISVRLGNHCFAPSGKGCGPLSGMFIGGDC